MREIVSPLLVGLLLFSAAEPLAGVDLPLDAGGDDGEFKLDSIRRFAFQGKAPGYEGLFAADHNGNGRSEIYVTEERNNEGYWYQLEYTQGQYPKKFISNVSQTPLAELNPAVWEGENAIISISEGGEGVVYRASDLAVIETFNLPARAEKVRNFSYVKDPGSGDRLLFVVYGPVDGPLAAYSYPSMDVVWESAPPMTAVSDVEVANLDGDSGLEVAMSGWGLTILDWETLTVQWSFGSIENRPTTHVKIGNLDSDPGLEVAGIADWYVAFVADAVDESLSHISNLGDIDSLSLADINEDGIDELVIGNGQFGSIRILDAQDFAELETVQNPAHGAGGTAVADFDGDGQLEITWGGEALTSGPASFLGMADVDSGVLARYSVDEGEYHDLLRIADVDSDASADLVLVSSYGDPSGRIHVIDYASGLEKWQSAPFAENRGAYGYESFDVFQFDQDPQSEIAVATARFFTPRIEVYDGNNGSLQSVFVLGPDFGQLEWKRIRAIRLNGTNYFVLQLGSRIRLVNWQGQVAWSSDELTTNAVDFWVQNIDADASQELIAAMQDGVAIYKVPATAPHQFHETTMTSAVLEDFVNGGGKELLVGKEDGSIQVLNLNGFSMLDEFQMPHAVQSFQYDPGFLGFGVLVVSGDNQVSLMRMDTEEIAPVVEIPGLLFGQVTDLDVLNRSLRIAVSSSYAVHDMSVSFDDLIFASSME